MSSLVWIRGQQWRLIVPNLIYVINNDERYSHTGLPLWMRTGIFLRIYMGFNSKRRGLLLLNKSSCLYSYLIPISASAILNLIPNRLSKKSSRINSSAIVKGVKILKQLEKLGRERREKKLVIVYAKTTQGVGLVGSWSQSACTGLD